MPKDPRDVPEDQRLWVGNVRKKYVKKEQEAQMEDDT